MQHSCEAVLRLIDAALPLFGAAPGEPCRDTGWIRCGSQHCRRFEFDGLRAVWFLETALLKFYRPDRSVLKVVWLDQALGIENRAA